MLSRVRIVTVSIFTVLLSALLWSQDKVTVPAQLVSYPTLIVYNGKVVSMDDESTTTNLGTVAQAMAIRNDRVLALGTNEQILALAGSQTEKIDLKGRTVVPGIIDSHTHIHNNELNYWITQHPDVVQKYMRNINISGKTVADMRRGIELALKEVMGTAPDDQWAFLNLPNNDGGSGKGPGVAYVQDHQMTIEDLNKLSPKRPVFIASHPAYMINDAARKAIKDLYGFEPLVGEGEEMDENQQGGLVLYARALIADGYFKDHIEELTKIVNDGLLKNAAVGITTFSSHMMGLRFMDAFQILDRAKKLPIRFAYTHYYGFQDNPDPASFYRRLGDMAGMGSDYFWTTGVGMGNIDDGPPMFCSTIPAKPEIKKREYCKIAPGTSMGKGLYAALISRERIAIGHAYADKGLDIFMDYIDQAMKEQPSLTLDYMRSRRFSSDHCGLYPRPDQIPRMAKLNMMLSCGGNVLDRTYPWLEVYGKQYAKWISPIKSLIDGGVRVVFENEAGVKGTVANTYLFEGVPLITRKNWKGFDVSPEEAVDRNILMKMMTSWPSYFVLRENELGSLKPGKLADFLVLNKDYFSVPINDLINVYPYMTVVGGKAVFVHKDYAPEIGKKPEGIQVTFKNEAPYDY